MIVELVDFCQWKVRDQGSFINCYGIKISGGTLDNSIIV